MQEHVLARIENWNLSPIHAKITTSLTDAFFDPFFNDERSIPVVCQQSANTKVHLGLLFPLFIIPGYAKSKDHEQHN